MRTEWNRAPPALFCLHDCFSVHWHSNGNEAPAFGIKWFFLLEHPMTILLIIVLVLLFGGGGGYYAHGRYGGTGLGGVLGIVVIVLLVLWLFGGIGHHI
jgi:hypothetical protein